MHGRGRRKKKRKGEEVAGDDSPITWDQFERSAYAAGMSPEGFWDSTIREVLLIIQGYRKRELAEWERTRFEAYIVYCSVTEKEKREPIYKFLELDSDPTEEELRELQEKQEQERMKKAQEDYEYYKTLGAF
jgi:hypothetical protein